MNVHCQDVRLSGYTTLRLGGPARTFVEVTTEDDLVAAVRAADRDGEPVLVLGGGSNLVVSDAGFPGTVVRVATRGVSIKGGTVRAEAGEDWDALVARTVTAGLAGLECLSGIPGRVGATPIQNVGAYGQDVSETVTEVRVYDRVDDAVRTLKADECGFTYRHSVFKGHDRYVVLSVAFELAETGESRPVKYAELARRLGVAVGECAPLADVRAAVLELRRGKGMVLDPADPDTRSAGSFFTNPILTPAELAVLAERAEGFPAFPEPDGRTKTSAAWLIDRAGFARGHARGPVRLSTKHTLALTNPGPDGTAADLLALAREVREGVRAAFGVTLVNEPVFIGLSLDEDAPAARN
ncbi:UDP-N-acetylmuramate dehydrogenase [Actinocorallia sp. A-T 12471]|uniref:UDP-N-acetylmuramate dehydrogenase n=1 Tax=Actinocorallia sp. A-T 12471 TaxID=3089813 RepID=UPI0029CBB197|nr:UDP-N-acetylmuramate dehydrogenase [Actinocorallia sp. A-T 12471]MDX6738267.1 UDP-N-acetylmuramate dehydrogenase [Actinocorallia sp. A-T 12471]